MGLWASLYVFPCLNHQMYSRHSSLQLHISHSLFYLSLCLYLSSLPVHPVCSSHLCTHTPSVRSLLYKIKGTLYVSENGYHQKEANKQKWAILHRRDWVFSGPISGECDMNIDWAIMDMLISSVNLHWRLPSLGITTGMEIESLDENAL